jgi:hypothetical protein
MGTAILSVRSVGELQSRDARKVLEIYRNLSKSNALMPSTVAFVFDRECLTAEEQRELKNLGEDLVYFLPRRLYENDLLKPAAIAAVVNSIEGFRENAVTPSEVQELIDAKRNDASNFCGRQVPQDASAWTQEIDAAKVLKEIFTTLSEARVAYDKVIHSVALTEFLVEHDPAQLNELAEWLKCLLDHKTSPTKSTAP